MICPPVEQDLTVVKMMIALLVGVILGRALAALPRD